MSLRNSHLIVSICLLIVYLAFSPRTASACVGLSWLAPGLTVRVDPATSNVESGHAFTVNVMVDGAVDLGAFQFDILYDTGVVIVTHVELGPLLGSTGRTAQSVGPNVDNVAGIVTFAAFSFGSSAGPEGAGRLAAITFTPVGPGTSALDLQNVVVTDTMANAQSASVEDGVVTVAAPVPTHPPTPTPRPTVPHTPMPAPTSTAPAAETAEPMPTFTPTGAATATATGDTTMAPTAPPVATDTATPVAPVLPTPTGPLASTPDESPLPRVTVTDVRSATPGAVSSRMPASTPQPPESPLATATAVGLLSASPTPSPSPTASLSSPLCSLPVGAVSPLVILCVFRALRRRHRE